MDILIEILQGNTIVNLIFTWQFEMSALGRQ